MRYPYLRLEAEGLVVDVANLGGIMIQIILVFALLVIASIEDARKREISAALLLSLAGVSLVYQYRGCDRCYGQGCNTRRRCQER